MFIQFGYVFLFSSVYPLASFFAVMNNVLEIRVDAFKLCRLYQRPMGRRVKDTGAWQVIESVLQLVQLIRSSKKTLWHLLSVKCFKLRVHNRVGTSTVFDVYTNNCALRVVQVDSNTSSTKAQLWAVDESAKFYVTASSKWQMTFASRSYIIQQI